MIQMQLHKIDLILLATAEALIRTHSAPACMARTTAAIQAAAPNAMIEWVRIRANNQNDPADGLIDLLHVGGPAHLVDGIEAVELEPVTFFGFVRKGLPTARDRSAQTASKYRYPQVAAEDTGGTPIEKEHRLLYRPGTPDGKVHDFSLVSPVLAA